MTAAGKTEHTSLKHAHSQTELHEDHKRHKHSDDGGLGTSHRLMPPAEEPLLSPAGIEETITAYYARLKEIVDAKAWPHHASLQEGPAGLYLHKRPVNAPDGRPSPLVSCGSVFHHCVLLIKDATGKVHSLDYGPANGADVTSTVMESLQARECLASNVDVAALTEGTSLPFMYLGQLDLALDDEQIQQAIQVAESRQYNVVRNNCIHFADAMARVLTQGRIRSAPHIYDIVCGQVQDNPAILMLQMLMRVSWVSVCDGSDLFKAMTQKAAEPTTSSNTAAATQPAAQPPDLVKAAASALDSTTPPAALAMQFLAALSQAAQPSAVPTVPSAGGSSEAVPSAP